MKRKSAVIYLMIVISFMLILFSNTTLAKEITQNTKKKLEDSVVLFIGNPNAYVKGNNKLIDTTNVKVFPMIVDGKTVVPIRFISESLGAKVDWNQETSLITISLDNKVIEMIVGDKRIWVNGNQIITEVYPQIINGRTFIPLRVLVESLDKELFWDNRGLIIISNSKVIQDQNREKTTIDEIAGLFYDFISPITNAKKDSFKDGDNFYEVEAQVKNGKLNGRGKLFINGRLFYHGEWKDDDIEGYGRLYYEDGNLLFEGVIYAGDDLCGKGRIFTEEGQLVYEGEMKQYQAEGYGIVYDEEGQVAYEGEFEMNEYIGNFNELLRMPFKFEVTDATIHPNKDIIYVIDKKGKKLYAVNYQAKQLTELALSFEPEAIYYANNKLYIALVKGPHKYVGQVGGAVAIIDANNLKLIKEFDIDIDPYDIVVDKQGYIYISSGSDQWTKMKCYSEDTKQEVSSTSIRMQSYIAYNNNMNRIYTIDTDSSPRDIRAYNISSGTFTDKTYPGGYDSRYHGDYSMNKNMKISPDGKYIFNGSGNIFACNSEKAEDMKYTNSISKPFYDITFDNNLKRFFTSVEGNFIYSYDYSTFKGTNTYKTNGKCEMLFYRNNNVIAVSKVSLKDKTKYGIEIIDIN